MINGNSKFEYLVYDMKDKELLVAYGDIGLIEKFTGVGRSAICRAIKTRARVQKRYKIRKVRL